MTDVSILVSSPPRGLGLEVNDRGLMDHLRRNPESLSKDAAQHFLKQRFITAIAGKVFAVRALSLPNVVRAIGKLLTLANPHNRK